MAIFIELGNIIKFVNDILASLLLQLKFVLLFL